jgi:hypothetical protein
MLRYTLKQRHTVLLSGACIMPSFRLNGGEDEQQEAPGGRG